MRRILIPLLFTLYVGTATAGAGNVPLDLNAPASNVGAQIKKINDDLSAGEVYSELSVDQRSQVREALARITAAMERHPGAGTLPKREEAGAFNDQEIVNTILTKAREDSRMVCRREKATGSHRSVSNCMTVAKRRLAREQGEKDMTSMQRRHKNTPKD